jgi:RNA polymerase sigma-70 factor (ECF subfamily)
VLIAQTLRPQEASLVSPPQVREVVERHGPFVCRSLRHLGVREDDLDDTMQDVFLVVHRRLEDYEERGRTRAWLYSICRRVVVSQRRKLARWQDKKNAANPPEPSIEPTQLAHVENREALELGYQLLDQLTKEERQIFLLYEVEDMPMIEIAQALGCRLQTAYSRLYKARTRILAAAERAVIERTED